MVLIDSVEIKFESGSDKPPLLGAFFLPKMLNFEQYKSKLELKFNRGHCPLFLFNY